MSALVEADPLPLHCGGFLCKCSTCTCTCSEICALFPSRCLWFWAAVIIRRGKSVWMIPLLIWAFNLRTNFLNRFSCCFSGSLNLQGGLPQVVTGSIYCQFPTESCIQVHPESSQPLDGQPSPNTNRGVQIRSSCSMQLFTEMFDFCLYVKKNNVPISGEEV